MSADHQKRARVIGKGQRFPWVCAFVFAVLVTGPMVWAMLALDGGGSYQRRWMVGAMTSRLSVVCAVVLVVCAGALVGVCRLLWEVGASRRGRVGGQEGAAILEFALVLPIAMALVLVMVQCSLLMGGNLCVHYAAFCAARSAVVYVPDDFSPGEPPNLVSEARWSGKLRRIRDAAVWAVFPISCGHSSYPEEDVGRLREGLEEFFDGYGQRAPGWVDGRIGRKLQYAQDHTEVDLHPPADGLTYAPHEDLRVTVRHTFYLSVPYANWVFRHLDRDDGVDLDFGDGEYGMVITASCTLTNEGVRDYVDIERFAESGR
jgi:hypothetical protein